MTGRDYLIAHAVDLDLAENCGVKIGERTISYSCARPDGSGYRRVRHLHGKLAERGAIQPRGEPLTLWWPAGHHGGVILLAEGEPDALAALSALRGEGELSPPLHGLTVAALPGNMPADRAAEELQGVGAKVTYLALDADDAGRRAADRLGAALAEVGIDAPRVDLPDGCDLADVLADAEDRTRVLAGLVAEAEAEPPADEPPPAKTHPRRRFVPRQLAEELRAQTPIAVAASGRLHVYRGGAYRPDGDRDLRERIAARLGDEWKRAKADEVIAFLRDSSPRLLSQPPRSQINVANGILDLQTGRLGPHDPDFLSPVQIAAAFDPEVECSGIDAFLAEVLDPELVPVIHELAGYLLTPDQSLQIAVMLLGEGSNGKSTLLSLLTALLGAENVANVALHRLDEDRFAAADLEGKLANVFADLDARALRASSVFKSITGGDAITGERKYAPAFSFRPFARLLYSANEPPPTPDSSDAFFRRWLILPFEKRFSGRRVERRILDRLTTPEELSGLLNHGVAALPALLDRGGFATTAAAGRAAERFRVDSDSVAGFLGERCELDPKARVARTILFAAYRDWCEDNNLRALGKQKFNRRIEALYPTLTVGPIQGIEHWLGIDLRGSL